MGIDMEALDQQLQDVLRQKADVQKDATIGQLMFENAQLKFKQLLIQEEAIKQQMAKEKKKK